MNKILYILLLLLWSFNSNAEEIVTVNIYNKPYSSEGFGEDNQELEGLVKSGIKLITKGGCILLVICMLMMYCFMGKLIIEIGV